MGTSRLFTTAGGGSGGGNRDRTGDLLHAMQALSQLSYTPTQGRELYHAERCALSRSSTRFLPASASIGPRLGVCARPNTIIRSGIASFGNLNLCLSITAWIALMTDSARQSASAAKAAASSASAGRTSSLTESRDEPGEIRVGALPQILVVEPAQFLRIELRGGTADVGQVEPLQELLERKHFLVPVRPAEAREVVDQGLGEIAVLPVLHDAHRSVALRQALAVGAENHGDMGELRQLRAERSKDIHLARSIVDVIVAADHVRDAHVEVVHHHAEVVGRNAVGAQQHEIVQLRVRHRDRTLDDVVKNNVAFVRIAEAHHWRPVRRRDEPGRLRALRAPAPVVAGLLAARTLALAHRVELFLGRPATVGLPLLDQSVGDFLVASEPLHLKERTFVPVEPEPAHGVENRLHRSVGGALEVGVLDAQDEFAAVFLRVRPGEERGAGSADVEVAGGAGGEARWENRGGTNGGIVRDEIARDDPRAVCYNPARG